MECLKYFSNEGFLNGKLSKKLISELRKILDENMPNDLDKEYVELCEYVINYGSTLAEIYQNNEEVPKIDEKNKKIMEGTNKTTEEIEELNNELKKINARLKEALDKTNYSLIQTLSGKAILISDKINTLTNKIEQSNEKQANIEKEKDENNSDLTDLNTKLYEIKHEIAKILSKIEQFREQGKNIEDMHFSALNSVYSFVYSIENIEKYFSKEQAEKLASDLYGVLNGFVDFKRESYIIFESLATQIVSNEIIDISDVDKNSDFSVARQTGRFISEMTDRGNGRVPSKMCFEYILFFLNDFIYNLEDLSDTSIEKELDEYLKKLENYSENFEIFNDILKSKRVTGELDIDKINSYREEITRFNEEEISKNSNYHTIYVQLKEFLSSCLNKLKEMPEKNIKRY